MREASTTLGIPSGRVFRSVATLFTFTLSLAIIFLSFSGHRAGLNRCTCRTIDLLARLHVRCGVAFIQCLFDFIFDGAGGSMTLFDIPPTWNHHVEVDPVISAAMAMA